MILDVVIVSVRGERVEDGCYFVVGGYGFFVGLVVGFGVVGSVGL